MKKKSSRIAALVLTLCMVFFGLPVAAMAAGSVIMAGTADELITALAEAEDGDTVRLTKDIVMTPSTDAPEGSDLAPAAYITSSITLDLNGKKISYDESSMTGDLPHTALLISVMSGAKVTITGNGTIDVECGNNNSYGINIVEGSSVIVENGTFTGATTAIQVQNGTLTIHDGNFIQAKTVASLAPQYAKYVINCIDASFKNGTARIYAQGGKYCFDPSNKPEASDVTYVPAGYVCKQDGKYWVVRKIDDGQMIVTPDTSSGSPSATLDGVYDGKGTTIATEGEGEGESSTVDTNTGSVVIDLSNETATTTSATLTVTNVAAASLSSAPSLTVKTDAGDVTLPEEALQKVAEAGKGGNDVTVTVTKENDISGNDIKAAYTVKVEANGKNLLPASASDNGKITITVAKPADAAETLQAWYAVQDASGNWLPVELLDSEENNGKLAITITHLSTVILYNTPQTNTVEATVTTSAGKTTAYLTLQAAVNNAKAGDVIRLMNDTDLDTSLEITKSLTLDLNGKKITSTNGLAFAVSGNATFTIKDSSNSKDGEIKSTKTGNCNLLKVSSGEIIVESGNLSNEWYVIYVSQSGKATIKGGTLTSSVASVLSTNGSYSANAVMNVEGGKLVSTNDVTIYLPAGRLNITGGEIVGATAVYSKSGVTNISGNPVITGNGVHEDFKHTGDGCYPTGDAMVVEACGYPNGNPEVYISGGTFTSEHGESVAYYQHNNNKFEKFSITGGKFDSDVSAYLADGMKWDSATGAVVPKRPTSTSDDTPSLGYRLPYIGESTGGKNFVSDTTSNLTVNGKYQFRITSTDGHKPVMTVSNSNFTVELASQSGNDYFYVIRCAGAAGSTANVLVDGIHVVTATVGMAGVVSDTTHPFTVAQGAAYQFKLTSASRPTFTGNNANFTIAYVSNSGNDWFFKVTAAGAAGASTTFSANGVVVTTATIA